MSGGDYLNRDGQMDRLAESMKEEAHSEVLVERADITAITDERGNNYGHPYDHFNCTQAMYEAWSKRRTFGSDDGVDQRLDRCLRHIAYLICDKLARAAQNPMHMDNFDDIQGYASLWAKCVERESK